MGYEAIAAEKLCGHVHDLLHVKRVVKNALFLAEEEGADAEVVEAAAWLHDLGRPFESETGECHAVESARIARELLASHPKRDAIVHCIECHRFSRGPEPDTLEGKILQDADRLDALGAVGIARIFAFGGQHGRPMYDEGDPFADSREVARPSGKKIEPYSVDHFYNKQIKLPSLMHTESARREAERRWAFMEKFLAELRGEIC